MSTVKQRKKYFQVYSHVYNIYNIYILIYTCNHENNVPSRSSPQWLYGNSCTWAHDVRLYILIYLYIYLYILIYIYIYIHLKYIYIFKVYIYIYIYIYIHIYIYIYIYLCIYKYIYILKLNKFFYRLKIRLLRRIMFLLNTNLSIKNY